MNVYRRLAISAVAALVSVGAAVVSVGTTAQQSEPLERSTPTSPGAVWTLDASDVLGNEFATFQDPVGGRFGEKVGGVIEAGDVLVTEVGVTNQETREFDKSELVGLDASTGEVQWTTSAEGISNCSTSLLGALMLCSSGSDVVAVNTADGTVSRHATGWEIFSVATDGTDIYVMEGAIDGYTTRIHRGTLDDPDSRWSLSVEDAYVGMSLPGDMIEFVGGLGVTNFLSSTVVFDPAAGAVISNFGVPDCVRARSVRGSDVRFVLGRHCSDLFEYRTDVVDMRGRVLGTVDAEVYQRITIDAPAQQDDPVLLNGNAFDPSTGRMIWSCAQDEYGCLYTGDVAIVGNVVLAGGAAALDLHSGEPAWPSTVEPLPVTPEVLHDDAVWLSDFEEIVAVDPSTGSRREPVSVEGLLGNTEGLSDEVELFGIRDGVVVLNEARLNVIR
ncbi:PQQ-binding-like beta-propeller repeat protein [Rhodococcus sp. IEGM 1381]|uniref:outer membrane protein assembly factor BamB family protein n=1 Tax=Rhodococcus sp. IEGM 1381 TaxID=3047085 RepID=UPI0024B65946|nr:PQQ-binding-like beta-propeller repeat protein [Rhodococcus sp. IEGM 1381]MDI9894980.1 PQQ-binding-like beta-propeller repeat protein [Rhodococcus sp. IEGM 1381]